jgi:hypothetical protein
VCVLVASSFKKLSSYRELRLHTYVGFLGDDIYKIAVVSGLVQARHVHTRHKHFFPLEKPRRSMINKLVKINREIKQVKQILGATDIQETQQLELLYSGTCLLNFHYHRAIANR